MKYKLTLTSDNYLNGGQSYRPVVVQFETEEEFKKYVAGELAYCKNEYKEFSKAWTKEQRKEAFAKLVGMRMAFKAKWFKEQDTEKELA